MSISTPRLTLGDGGIIGTGTFPPGAGRAGDIAVEVGRSALTEGAFIDSSSFGAGPGGRVGITAADAIAIAGRGSGLFSRAQGRGPGGAIDLRARHIQLSDGSTIAASSFEAGDAGAILMQAGETFRSENSHVATAADRAGGGTIALHAGRLVQLQDSELTTTVRGGGGDAGDLTPDVPFIVADRRQVIANACGGRGDNIQLRSEVFLRDPASREGQRFSPGRTRRPPA